MEAYFFIITSYYYFKKLIYIKQKSIQIGQKFIKWITRDLTRLILWLEHVLSKSALSLFNTLTVRLARFHLVPG